MENPWINLPNQPPYVLSVDRTSLGSFSKKPISTELRFEVIPTPFIGNPLSAKVILLALNPGFSEEDVQLLSDHPEFLQADIHNLTFNNNPPFYALNEEYGYSGLFRWWDRRLKDLITVLGRDRVASSISCVQFFPYHSKTYSPLKELLPSQQYNFHLVKTAIMQRKTIVIMRSEALWTSNVPELKGYPYIRLKVPRNPYFNKNNMTEKDFKTIVDTLLGN